MPLFDSQKFDLEIKVPANIEIVPMEDKVRFRGTKEAIIKFAKEFYRLRALNNGQLCKLDRYTLKVSDYITSDRAKENWIELPIMPGELWRVNSWKFPMSTRITLLILTTAAIQTAVHLTLALK